MVAELARRDTGSEHRGDDGSGRGADDLLTGTHVKAHGVLERTQRAHHPCGAEHTAGAQHEPSARFHGATHPFSLLDPAGKSIRAQPPTDRVVGEPSALTVRWAKMARHLTHSDDRSCPECRSEP